MWQSKGYIRAVALIMLMVGNFMSGGGWDLSSVPEILMTLGAPLGVVGIINALIGKK